MKYVEKGEWPDTRRFFSVMRCNHCSDAPCVAICPTRALYRRKDGIVDFDTDRCIGCKSCMQACPYDALYIDPGENTAQKCNYCVHRVEVGLEPACVVVCPEQSIIAGDLDNPSTRIARLVATEQTFVRAPEQNTKPNLFYKGVDEANIDPLRASVPADGGIWRDFRSDDSWLSVELTPATSSGDSSPGPNVVYERLNEPPRVVYNNDHPMPWGWRVSSYFLTKGVAAGLALTAAVALIAGADVTNSWMRWGVPLVAGVFLAITGVLLVADLKRPDRFLYLITKGNPGSWLVRGAWILSGYAAVLAGWFVTGALGSDGAVEILIWVSVPLALATAGYTKSIAAAGNRVASHTWRGAGSGNLHGWQVARCLWFIQVLTGSVGTVGGTSPSGWDKFKPAHWNMPPPHNRWNELLWPAEYPFAHHEMSFLLPYFLKEGREAKSTCISPGSTTRCGPIPMASPGLRCSQTPRRWGCTSR